MAPDPPEMRVGAAASPASCDTARGSNTFAYRRPQVLDQFRTKSGMRASRVTRPTRRQCVAVTLFHGSRRIADAMGSMMDSCPVEGRPTCPSSQPLCAEIATRSSDPASAWRPRIPALPQRRRPGAASGMRRQSASALTFNARAQRLLGQHETSRGVHPRAPDHELVVPVLSRLDERREFLECLPPSGLVVGCRHAGR